MQITLLTITLLLAARPKRFTLFTALIFGAVCTWALYTIAHPMVSAWVCVFISSLLCTIYFRPAICCTVLLSFAMAVVLTASSNTQERFTLERRYGGAFDHVYGDTYYSHILKEEIVYREGKGDNYQALLYEQSIVAECASCLPFGVKPVDHSVEEVITDYLAFSVDDYMEVIRPQVHLYLGVILEQDDIEPFPTDCKIYLKR